MTTFILSLVLPVLVVLGLAIAAFIFVKRLRDWITRQWAKAELSIRQAGQRRHTADVKKQVNAAPFRAIMPTADERLAYVRVRPTQGDVLPRRVLDELERFVANIPRKEIRRGLRVEYREDAWHTAERGRLSGS